MGRRAAGEGSIYKLKDGTFAAMLDIGYVDGKRKRKKFTGKTRREVAEKLANARRQLANGLDMTTRPQTLGGFLTRWLADNYTPTKRPKSVATYSNVIDRYIVPKLGEVMVQKLTGQQVQQLVSDLMRDAFAPATVHLVHTVLHQALQQAVHWHMIEHNPADHIDLPKIERRIAQTLTIEQARAVLDAARGERMECALRLALSLGLRVGEVCGLQWADVDLERGMLHVRGTLQHVPGHGLVYGNPKTESSRRSIKLPAALLAALRWHQERQRAERAAMGDAWQASDYVFVASRSGGPIQAVILRRAFKDALAKAELPTTFRFHDLRHSCASFLIAQNVHPKVISAILGHASIQITMNLYGHLLPGALDDAAGQVDALLNDSSSGGNTRGNTGTNE